jgi:hypothetical protein
MALIDLRGLRIRKVRSALSEPASMAGTQETTLMTTMKKSRQFQPLLQYEFLCQTRPSAMILQTHSTRKMTEKMLSK